MSDPRYVIVDLADYSMMMPAKRTNLPDAEHIHVTRLPDGTITATPMQRPTTVHQKFTTTDDSDGSTWTGLCARDDLWVDCPTGVDQ